MNKFTAMIPDCVIGFPDFQNEIFLEAAARLIGLIWVEGVEIMFCHVALVGRDTTFQ